MLNIIKLAWKQTDYLFNGVENWWYNYFSMFVVGLGSLGTQMRFHSDCDLRIDDFKFRINIIIQFWVNKRYVDQTDKQDLANM